MKPNNIVSFEDGELEIRVKVDKIKDTVWLSQKDVANLFGCFTDNIGLHLKNIFKCGGFNRNSVAENSSSTASDGKRYNVKVYNLDAIISIGYRVN